MKKGFKFTTPIQKSCIDCQEDFISFSAKSFRCVSCSKSAEYRNNMLDFKWRLNKLCSMAKNRANQKELPFNLTKDYLIELWNRNQGLCEITKRPFDLKNYGKSGQVNPNAPSVDRIVPELGYVIGNVRLVTYHVNVALSEYGLKELILLAKDVAFR